MLGCTACHGLDLAGYPDEIAGMKAWLDQQVRGSPGQAARSLNRSR